MKIVRAERRPRGLGERVPRGERFRGSTMVMRAAARPGGWGPAREARSSSESG